MLKFFAGSVLGCVFAALAVQPLQAETYKAVRDFSYMNPSGVWSYGYGKTGRTFSRFPRIVEQCGTTNEEDCFRNNANIVGLNTSSKPFPDAASSTVLIGENVLMMHPSDGADTIVSFRAPRTGTYRVTGFFQIMDTAPSGVVLLVYANGTDISKTAFKTTTTPVVLSGPPANRTTLRGGGKRAFDFSYRLTVGQFLYFAINPNGTSNFDSTGFSAEVQIGTP